MKARQNLALKIESEDPRSDITNNETPTWSAWYLARKKKAEFSTRHEFGEIDIEAEIARAKAIFDGEEEQLIVEMEDA